MAFAAQHPEHIANLILMAPFVAPIPAQEDWVRTQITENRFMFPANPATDDELYSYFLHELVFATFPAAEPIVLENPYKLEATFRLVEGSHTFMAKDYVDALPAGTVHLMVARKDQYVPASQHEEFWNELPMASRGSRIFIEGSEHKIPEAVPAYSAAWVIDIMSKSQDIRGGKSFEGNPKEGTAKSGTQTINHLGN
jgi:pimeloyl-ACP methyl ester carboxylesterase